MIKDIENYLDENKYLYYIEDNTLFISNPINRNIKLLKTDNKNTINWLLDKLNKNNYKNMVAIFEKVLNNNTNWSIYPSSYGIGIFLNNGFYSNSDVEIKKIRDYLNKNNINYKWEYSDKCFVYRFKISQSKENLNKIKSLNSESC